MEILSTNSRLLWESDHENMRLSLEAAVAAGANLGDANLGGVTAVIDAGCPDGWTAYGWLCGGWLVVCVGCRQKRLLEARTYWSNSHRHWDNRREISAALDYIEAIATLRGWAVTEPGEAEDVAVEARAS